MALEITKTANIGVVLEAPYQTQRDSGKQIQIDTLIVNTHHIDSLDKGLLILYINPSINVLVKVGMIEVLSYMGTSFDIGEALSDRGIVVENFVYI